MASENFQNGSSQSLQLSQPESFQTVSPESFQTVSPESFQLYNYFRSSASHRVRLALEIKKTPYEYKAVHLLKDGGEQHLAAYEALNPLRQVPTLVHQREGHTPVVLGQSLAIMDYLDALFPTVRLFPEAPAARALCLQACEIVNSGTQPLFNLCVLKELGTRFNADQSARDEWAKFWTNRGLEALEKFLKPHAGRFCFGDEFTAADCVLIPQLFSADRFALDMKPFPTLQMIRANCDQHEAFIKASPFRQVDTPEELRQR